MRGIGQTELMIANLPSEACTIVAPSREIGMEIAARVHKVNPGSRRYITIKHPTDVAKLSGLSEPVFFDHSFFDLVTVETARKAVAEAIPCAHASNWRVAA